ncbi:hypothetical protein EMPG_14289 [Blastomyces silverae]|uniref:Uncharacterized protein n=1 Tax=Blastomyces silverae TaxID=2060906 RepID=A0A0H1BH35_9EURO|nr:hypothetical protein EMPG_14289 [Blastomyces silverae]
MLDCDVAHLIEGAYIYSPRNTISLTWACHELFGDFEVYFDSIAGEERVETFQKPNLVSASGTTYYSQTPSQRRKGAGEYVDKLLQDFDETGGHEDGSTHLGQSNSASRGEEAFAWPVCIFSNLVIRFNASTCTSFNNKLHLAEANAEAKF